MLTTRGCIPSVISLTVTNIILGDPNTFPVLYKRIHCKTVCWQKHMNIHSHNLDISSSTKLTKSTGISGESSGSYIETLSGLISA